MLFPTDFEFIETEQTEESETATIGRSFVFDCKTGQFVLQDGRPVETDQKQAVQQWLELLLRTHLDKYKVYQGSGFGTTMERYIGQRALPAGYIASEAERELSEAARLCPAIDRLTDFQATRTTRGLQVRFEAVLKNSETMEVNAIV